MAEIVDMTACIAGGTYFSIGKKEYEIKFTFGAIRSLEEQYGNVGAALDSLVEKKDIYNDVLNFLYAACGERYKMKKTDIEKWISISSCPIFYNLIVEAVFSSIGMNSDAAEQGET
jgi:hypothetical protein